MILHAELPAVRRRGRTILRHQRVHFPAGATTILGLNGAGKTTLFTTLLGVSSPGATSTLEMDGSRIASDNRRDFMAQVGYLPQEVPSPSTLSVSDFLGYCAWLKGFDPDEAAAKAALEQVNLDSEANTAMSKLSGGMRRRAGIAAALIHRPSILVFDEPTAGLDPLERQRLHRLVRQLAGSHVLIVSTHLLEDARAFEGDIRVLAGGELAQVDGSTGTLTDDDLIALMQGGSQ